MKNLPFFATESGIASLTLDQIPYTQNAYITLQSVEYPEKLIGECVDFCKAVGAERIYACNHDFLQKFPVHTSVLEMVVKRVSIPTSPLSLVAVTEGSAEEFCRIYNEKMQGVKTAGHISRNQLDLHSAYFVCENHTPVGIGIIKEDTVAAIASLRKGAGKDVLCALCQKLDGDTVRLEVASENRRAVALYNALGFHQNRVLNTWYKII